MKTRLLLTTFVLSLFLVCTAFAGQEIAPEEPVYSLSVSSTYIGDAELDNSSASFSTVNSAVEAKIYDFSVIYENETYSWNNRSDIDFVMNGETPWTSLQKLGVGYDSFYSLSDTGTVIYSVQLSSQFEDAITGDSLTVSGLVGYNYRINQNWSVNVGVAAGYNPLDWNVLPVAGLRYSYDNWEVNLGFPFSNVGYKFSDEFSVRADIGIDGGVYRLSDDSDVVEKGYVKKEEAKLSLLADWNFAENMKISAGPQYIFARTMKFYTNSHNRTGGKEEIDNTWGLTANISMTY